MLDQLLVIVSITFLIMISPGPDMVIVMRNTFAGGRPAGLQTSAGILTGNLVHISYCVLGIGWLISQSILAFNILKYAGAVYLIYLGIMSLLTKERAIDDLPTEGRRRNRSWFLQGFINNILNPKGTLFYLGVFTVVITPGTSPFHMAILILTMNIICTSFWLVFVYTLDRPLVRNWIERFQQAVHRVFGVLLVSLGIRVMTYVR